MSRLVAVLDRLLPSRVVKREISELREELLRVRTDLAAVQQQSLALSSGTTAIANQLAEARLWLEKISFETQNALLHLDGRIVTASNRLFNEALPQAVEQGHSAVLIGLKLRAQLADRTRWVNAPSERYQEATPIHFEETLRRAAIDFAPVIGPWRDRLDEMMRAFSATKAGNAANASDLYSQIFKGFVEVHVRGRVLDVGCGVFGKPFYLSEYPAGLISGIEPLPTAQTDEFECVRGIAEYLPWPTSAFSTVVNATSLDHSIDLESALRETRRVLTPNGVFILWIGSNPGSPPYQPRSSDFRPADQFHLFHFDVAWFEPLIERDWRILERIELRAASFSHVFYALTPLGTAAATA